MSGSIEFNKKAGRPKKEGGPMFDKKTYMRNYMKEYKQKNKDKQLARRNTSYYISKYNINESFVKKYGIYTAQIYKTFGDLKKIHKECPTFIEDISKYIETLKKENCDISGVENIPE